MVESRYKSVVDALASEIRTGRLPSGTRLPTHRDLAASEGLAVVTASRVYAELEAMGLVSGERGRGTFVRERSLPAGHGVDQRAAAPGMVDLNFNYPSLPGQADLLRKALRELASSGDVEALLRYQPHGGRPHERLSFACHLADRGIDVPSECVVVVSGAQHGLAVTALALRRPGDVVAVDALTYPGFKVVAATIGVELIALPADGRSPDLDALQRLCATRRVRAVYTMPTLHNPMGWVTGKEQRQKLIEIARRHDLLIIEDGAYAFLVADPPPPIAALAPECTVYVSGLSKSVATGLRVGFVAAPASMVADIERAVRATTWNTPAVMTAIACRWIDDGTVARLEVAKRDDAAARQRLASDVLGDLGPLGHPSSYFTWLPLPTEVRADLLIADCAAQGVSVSSAEPFATTRNPPHAIRLALGSPDLGDLGDALAVVRGTIESHRHR